MERRILYRPINGMSGLGEEHLAYAPNREKDILETIRLEGIRILGKKGFISYETTIYHDQIDHPLSD